MVIAPQNTSVSPGGSEHQDVEHMVYSEGISSRASPEQVCQPPVCEACLQSKGGRYPRFRQQC